MSMVSYSSSQMGLVLVVLVLFGVTLLGSVCVADAGFYVCCSAVNVLGFGEFDCFAVVVIISETMPMKVIESARHGIWCDPDKGATGVVYVSGPGCFCRRVWM